VTPCNPDCTCRNEYSSAGCSRCCTHGSQENREAWAEWLVSHENQSTYIQKITGLLVSYDKRISICKESEKNATYPNVFSVGFTHNSKVYSISDFTVVGALRKTLDFLTTGNREILK
jgi:hypothetical protein